MRALNDRGKVLCQIISSEIAKDSDLFEIRTNSEDEVSGTIRATDAYFPEEERSKQPSEMTKIKLPHNILGIFSLVRAIKGIFSSPEATQLGLYGAFGYDLAFQFERITLKHLRQPSQRDLILFLPDSITVVDNMKNDAWTVDFEFSRGDLSTNGLSRTSSRSEYTPFSGGSFEARDNNPGDYSKSVVAAKEQFRVGNLFEVVLSQVFRHKLDSAPSQVFRRLLRRNPSPYGFFMNLGRNEYLVGASPEMFVRVEKVGDQLRVETCPISGTIERGGNPLEDALQIKKLLQSAKEESELTMCTDVDRNDKSRICVPGSVRVLGRRQIEMYSRLIHTVDHVEGLLRANFDALDAFLCHTWAVTVTGAPKTWAMRFIESTEASPRHWYGGAVGYLSFDGTLNTGLTLRTVRIVDGIAEVRAGATLLHDSEPAAEEAETELKASALVDAVTRNDNTGRDDSRVSSPFTRGGADKRILLVDHEDSFVHTLANYLRQTGAEVVTCRSGEPLVEFIREKVDAGIFFPNLVVLSPGPGSPSDFKLKDTISALISRKIPIFGVCLGLQGLVEYFGGELGILDYPMHGKPTVISRIDAFKDSAAMMNILDGLPSTFSVARYHSLFGKRETFPSELLVTAETPDSVVMAIQHSTFPIAAVQFHPESILTSPEHGMQIISNAVMHLNTSGYGIST